MFEAFFIAVMTILQSPWLGPVIAGIVGLVLPQPTIVANLWSYVMGARHQLDKVEQMIDTIDAVLKANGIIPTDAPKITGNEVKALKEGKLTYKALAVSLKARKA